MFTALLAVKEPFSSYLKYQEIKTDNVLFRLHCLLTSAVLLSASIVLTTTQLIGNPIECYSGPVPEKWQNAINTFCWVKSTFNMPENPDKLVQVQRTQYIDGNGDVVSYSYNRNPLQQYKNPEYLSWVQRYPMNTDFNGIGMHSAYPGIMNEYDTPNPKRHYTYYQWVCFVIFFQAILCYLPKAAWNRCESGLMARLATGLHGFCPHEEKRKKIDCIVTYLARYRKTHTSYALLYWACETLCLLNIVLQMWGMESFLKGGFFKYGISVLGRAYESQYNRTDPMIYIFPRMTKCTFNFYGPSGSIVNLDSLCILPQNIINEKTYIFLWFWYFFLAIVFVFLFIYRVMMVFLPGYRPQLLAARTGLGRTPALFTVSGRLDLGDWWLLYMLAKNMNPLIYRELIKEMAQLPDDTKTKRLYPDINYMGLDTVDSVDSHKTPLK